jgi:hypothetical protein
MEWRKSEAARALKHAWLWLKIYVAVRQYERSVEQLESPREQ